MKNSVLRYFVFLVVFSNLAFAKNPKPKKITKTDHLEKSRVGCSPQLPIGALTIIDFLILECNLDFRIIDKVFLGVIYKYNLNPSEHAGYLGASWYPMGGSFHIDPAIGFSYSYVYSLFEDSGYRFIGPKYELSMGNHWELESGLILGLKYNVTNFITSLMNASDLGFVESVKQGILLTMIGPEIGWKF